MSKFPKGSVRAAVAAVGDSWSLLHEPNRNGRSNNTIVAELRDAQVMRCCDDLSARRPRFSMLRRASFGLNAREARELIA